MQIYRKNNSGNKYDYYFMTTKENGLFCFSLELPDANTLQLCPCSIGPESEKKAFEEGIVVSDDIWRRFSKIQKQKNNYQSVCNLLMEVFADVTQEDFDNSFNKDDDLIELTKECINKSKRNVYDFEFSDIYQKVIRLMKLWNGDKDRVIKWVAEEFIPETTSLNRAMVDIFGTCHPTERMLLHKFYQDWGEKQTEIIKKCIEKYPDEKDFDLATYQYIKLWGEQFNKK